eukprot:TRINITY_DN653_c0_g1_i2.p3 TRINITY_DN653_c0_g1~~TRINITY_DN653_c0_g1_i2.p3  ORF type:complete len:165 (+),score=23.19 TRINITY_DN653_c0_g1_i2:1252-1746(+)
MFKRVLEPHDKPMTVKAALGHLDRRFPQSFDRFFKNFGKNGERQVKQTDFQNWMKIPLYDKSKQSWFKLIDNYKMSGISKKGHKEPKVYAKLKLHQLREGSRSKTTRDFEAFLKTVFESKDNPCRDSPTQMKHLYMYEFPGVDEAYVSRTVDEAYSNAKRQRLG